MEINLLNANTQTANQIKKYYSLRSIIKNFYLEENLERENNERKKIRNNNSNPNKLPLLHVYNLKGETYEEKMSYFESNRISTKPLPDLENYIKTKIESLFKMLDILFDDSQKKLKTPKGNYKFSEDDYLFIELFLHSPKYIEQLELLRSRTFNELDPTFLELLIYGIQNLIDNPNNQLKLQDVTQYFRMRINKEFIELITLLDSISGNLEYFYFDNDHNPNIDKIITSLKKCCNETHSLCTKNEITCSDSLTNNELNLLESKNKYIPGNINKEVTFTCDKSPQSIFNELKNALAEILTVEASEGQVPVTSHTEANENNYKIIWKTPIHIRDIYKIIEKIQQKSVINNLKITY